ncbi:MAG: hypothetical protein HZA93_17120 [Verrucomicrobia bacterium]|nr:hypothetical protein [Verrucomicrobiota bacterium]
MSKSGEALYMVTLKHLARDGKKAAADLPEVQLSYIPGKQLRGLLDALAALGPTVVFPVEPELRVTAPDGKYVVQLKGGRLQFVSWSSKHKGGEYSAARIYSIITGEEEAEAMRAQMTAGPASGGLMQSKAMLALLVVAIVAVNSFTFWFVSRPKKTLLPKYTVLAAEPARRVLENVAGFYETGERRLEIDKTGKVQRFKLGPERKLVSPQSFTVEAADAGGRQALVASINASRKTLITIKDPLSVVLYGDTYQRVQR